METFLYIVFFVSCIVLVISVLLQPGKTDAGALFTSGVSSAALNPRGTASVLSKLTIVTASIFMLSALFLSMPALTGRVSVLDTQRENTIAPAETNANSADSNVSSAPAEQSNTGAAKPEVENSGTGETNDEADKPVSKPDAKPQEKK